MTNPRWEELGQEECAASIERGLHPVYPANEHLSSTVISNLIDEVLELALPQIEDHFSNFKNREFNSPPCYFNKNQELLVRPFKGLASDL